LAGEKDGDYFLLRTCIPCRILGQRESSFSAAGPRDCQSMVSKILWLAIEQLE
jgi:hypothetical protein